MPGKVKPIPEGFHTLTPHLIVRDAKRAIDFYKRAFGAQQAETHLTPDGKVMHARLKFGDSALMLNDEFPEMGARSPQSLGGSPVTINIYTEDVDRLFNQAVSAGATVVMPLKDQFWGDRYGVVADPFGHKWSLCTHIEDVVPEELEKRAKAAFAEMAKKGGAAKPGSAGA
ncbi:MAG: glyoxalase [Acidobacteria bacterium]|nr:MAG: glyoxalase [Acidobacteriota bacterium]